MRDGLTLTTRAASGVEPMSSAVWIGASYDVAVEMAGEPLGDAGQVVRILQIRVREGRERVVVQREQGRRILDLGAVLALEVDRVDGARRGDLVDQRRRPARLGVELEVDVGGAVEPPAQRLDRRWLAEAQRVDEAHRLRLEAEHVVQRPAGLAQRQVERRGLERPAAEPQRHVPLGRLRPQRRASPAASQKLSSVHSPASGSAGCRSCSVVPSSLNTPTSSPSPSVSPPISRTWLVIRSKSYAIRARSGSYSQDSTTSGRSARRGHSDSPPIDGLPGFTSGSVAQGIPESSTRSGTVVVCPWTSSSSWSRCRCPTSTAPRRSMSTRPASTPTTTFGQRQAALRAAHAARLGVLDRDRRRPHARPSRAR